MIDKRLFLFSSAVFVFLAFSSGCERPEAAPAAASPAARTHVEAPVAEAGELAAEEPARQGPAIVVHEPVRDLGEVVPHSRTTLTYKFTNTGDKTLNIERINSTCGCSVPQLEKYEYAPGESGEVKVIYTAESYTHPVTRNMYIISNAVNDPEASMTIKSVSVLPVAPTPDFQQLALSKPNAGLEPIVLESRDGRPFSVLGVTSTGNAITAKTDSSHSAAKITIEPQADIERLRENLKGNIVIRINHPQSREVTVNYATPAEFEVVPANIFLQRAVPGEAVRREIWVLSNYDEPFEIESVTSEKGFAAFAETESLDTKHKLTVDITPPADQGNIRYLNDKIIITIKEGPTLTLNISGWMTAAN